MPLAPGDSVGRFTLRAPLGAGGMGAVFRAHDPQLDREVALKILRGDPDDRASAALLREARVAASLDHPHVVAVFEVGQASVADADGGDGGIAYMTMELVDGRPLKTFVGDRELAVERVVAWLVEVAQALAFAHRRGLVHGDVKPSNVMVRDDGHTKLLDFGIARRVARRDPEAITRTDTHSASASGGAAVPEGAGTPAYMAPEQLLGQPLDGRTDQFAWGVMAYELLVGARPWLSEREPVQLAAEILSRMPPPPAEASTRVPDVVSRVVMRALAKSPEERFATMDDLVAALVPLATSRPRNPERAVQRGGSESGTPAEGRMGRGAWKLVVATAVIAVPLVAFVMMTRAPKYEVAGAAQSSGTPPVPALDASAAPAVITDAPSAIPSPVSASALPSTSVAPPIASGAAPAGPKPAPGRAPSGAVDPKGRPIFWSP